MEATKPKRSSSTTSWLIPLSFLLIPLLSFAVYKWLDYPQPILHFHDDLFSLAQHFMSQRQTSNNNNNNSNNNNALLFFDLTVAITGATGGIGKALAEFFVLRGATVLALGRSWHKLERLEASLQDSPGSLLPVVVELGHLGSVSKAAGSILETVSSRGGLDILINNAGMHYNKGFLQNRYPTTEYGHDISFTVNYLSHVLLTEKLLPALQQPRQPGVIVQISSTFHWAVDGRDLLPATQTTNNNDGEDASTTAIMPLAARPGGGSVVWRDQRAYANSKLAQVLHMRALQEELGQKDTAVRVVSICPGWVATEIGGHEGSLEHFVMSQAAFPLKRFNGNSEEEEEEEGDNDDDIGWGIASTLYGIFETAGKSSNNDSYYINTKFVSLTAYLGDWFHTNWAADWGLRDMLVQVLATSMLIFQKFGPAHNPSNSSPESHDMELARALHSWSKAEIKPFL